MTDEDAPEAWGMERYLARTERSRELFAERQETFPGGAPTTVSHHPPYPPVLASAEGATVTDVDGNDYVDYLNKYTAIVAGHCHPAVREAVADQLVRIDVAHADVERRLAERLVGRIDSLDRLRFANSGTEAVMYAVRAARAYTDRDLVARFEGSYNGSVDEMQVSYHPPLKRAGRADRPRPVPDTAGVPDHTAENVVVLPWNDPDAVTDIVREHAEDLACVVASPRMGTNQIDPEAGFHAHVADLCADVGALYVLDEVVGYREGYGGAQADLGVTPDLTTLGKIIGGGLPVGAFGGRADVMSLFDPTGGGHQVFSSGTFTGNPATMAAGNAVLDLLDADAFAELNARSERLRESLRAAVESAGFDIQVTGSGSMVNVWTTDREVVDYRTAHTADTGLQHRVFTELLNRGHMLSPDLMGCLTLATTDAQCEALAADLEAVLAGLRDELSMTNPRLVRGA